MILCLPNNVIRNLLFLFLTWFYRYISFVDGKVNIAKGVFFEVTANSCFMKPISFCANSLRVWHDVCRVEWGATRSYEESIRSYNDWKNVTKNCI